MSRWTTAAILLVVAFAALSFGCRRRGATSPTQDARRIERYERNLIRLAARDSRCSPVQIQPVRIAETVWTANTCTGPLDYQLSCRSSRRRWAHCRWSRIPRVEEAASAVLMCPVQGIMQQPTENPMVRFAQGCGRQVQMNLGCNQVGCGWMAAGQPTGPAATGNTVVVVPAPPQ